MSLEPSFADYLQGYFSAGLRNILVFQPLWNLNEVPSWFPGIITKKNTKTPLKLQMMWGLGRITEMVLPPIYFSRSSSIIWVRPDSRPPIFQGCVNGQKNMRALLDKTRGCYIKSSILFHIVTHPQIGHDECSSSLRLLPCPRQLIFRMFHLAIRANGQWSLSFSIRLSNFPLKPSQWLTNSSHHILWEWIPYLNYETSDKALLCVFLEWTVEQFPCRIRVSTVMDEGEKRSVSLLPL